MKVFSCFPLKSALALVVFLTLSTASTLAQAAEIRGQILEAESRDPIPNVTVLLYEDTEGDGIPANTFRETATDSSGRYVIEEVPEGQYVLRFLKLDFRPATLQDVVVPAGETVKWDFPLIRVPRESLDIFNLEEFVVSAESISDEEYAFEIIRQQSVLSVDLLSGADLAKFAAGDVADAIKHIPGVAVQDGKFAVIRGLNERYSSTLLNGAPVPSPDPDKQSIPLDLFPSDIINNLVVSKTYSPSFPGNSAGGSIDIRTDLFPQAFRLKLDAGTEFNENVEDEFLSITHRPDIQLDFNNLGSIGNRDQAGSQSEIDGALSPVEKSPKQAYSVSLEAGGTFPVVESLSLGYKLVGSKSRKNASVTGFEHNQAASPFPGNRVNPIGSNLITGDGDFTAGKLSISKGRFDFTESTFTEEEAALASLTLELNGDNPQSITYTGFYSLIEDSIGTIRENGTVPEFTELELRRRGNGGYRALWLEFGGDLELLNDTRYWALNMVNNDRELTVHQFFGSHEFATIPGSPKITWNWSDSDANQLESNSFSANGYRLPESGYVIGTTTNLEGFFSSTASWRRTEETQEYYGADFSFTIGDPSALTMETYMGLQNEETNREILQEFFFMGIPIIDSAVSLEGEPTISELLNKAIVSANNTIPAVNAGLRDIESVFLGVKFNYIDKVILDIGFRNQDLLMTTFTNVDGEFFNSELLRLGPGNAPRTLASNNSFLLEYDGPLPSDFLGVIDQSDSMPAVNATVNITENLVFKAAYSETVVRPSFKEFSFITVRNPLTLDWESGNPRLETSDVRSKDLRLEYFFGEKRDLVAVSVFEKDVEKPIERTVLLGTVETEVFFNNPNPAEVRGIEFELRKGLGFLPWEAFRNFSFVVNYTLISAEVAYPERFLELFSGGLIFPNNRAGGGDYWAQVIDAEAREGVLLEPPQKRSLFDQPEWIFNFLLSYSNPDWGTTVDLSMYMQGETLYSSAGYVGELAVPDRYFQPYHEVNLVITQRLWESFKLTFAVENLTDSDRTLEYSSYIRENSVNREFTLGREYSFSIAYTF